MRYRNVTPTKWKILLSVFKWRALILCSSDSFEGIPSEKRFCIFGEHRNNFLRWYIFKTISATEKISTSFKSCKQDLSFGGCNFSVSYLVPEILAKRWMKRKPRFCLILTFLPKLDWRCVHVHVAANISGTRQDTEKLHAPNERTYLQL